MKKLLVIQVAALGWDLVNTYTSVADSFEFHPIDPIFPAVTCVAQATLRTALRPVGHGMIANGRYFRDLRRVMFWEQAASLVHGDRVWSSARDRGRTVGMIFWQQSLGEHVDLLLSPKPVHKHGGGMIQDCYGLPADLYPRLTESVGRPFNLMNYWGPRTSRRSSDWIVAAIRAVLSSPDLAPDVLFGYIPHLDYDLQKFGPDSKQAKRALNVTIGYLKELRQSAEERGYETLFVGDYAIGSVTNGAVFPNRLLREAGLFRVRSVRGRAYPDFYASPALAMVDHEIAHVFLQDSMQESIMRDVFSSCPGIAQILGPNEQKAVGIACKNSGNLVLVAAPGYWFAYAWWKQRAEAPDYASHVNIHNKPGFDPCELFMGWPPISVSQDTNRIQGSHGSVRSDRRIAWGGSCQFAEQPQSFLELARSLRDWIDHVL